MLDSLTGSVSGRSFNSKKAAETWLRAQKETKRKFRLGLRTLDIDQAADALQILDRHTTLVDAARFWKEHHKHESTRELEDTITAFIEHLRARDSRKRYIDSVEDVLLAFKRELGNVTLADCSITHSAFWMNEFQECNSQANLKISDDQTNLLQSTVGVTAKYEKPPSPKESERLA